MRSAVDGGDYDLNIHTILILCSAVILQICDKVIYPSTAQSHDLTSPSPLHALIRSVAKKRRMDFGFCAGDAGLGYNGIKTGTAFS